MPDERQTDGDTCGCLCRIRGFTQPALLVRLAAKASHGYELLDGLRSAGEPCCCDTGLVYRTLRQLEREGLVASSWDTGTAGPARRVYRLTRKGSCRLHVWAKEIETIEGALRDFLAEYHSLDTDCRARAEGE